MRRTVIAVAAGLAAAAGTLIVLRGRPEGRDAPSTAASPPAAPAPPPTPIEARLEPRGSRPPPSGPSPAPAPGAKPSIVGRVVVPPGPSTVPRVADAPVLGPLFAPPRPRVRAVPLSRAAPSAWVPLDDDGRFRIDGLEPGAYGLVGRRTPLSTDTTLLERVEAGDGPAVDATWRDAEVEEPKRPPRAFRVLAPDGTPVARFDVRRGSTGPGPAAAFGSYLDGRDGAFPRASDERWETEYVFIAPRDAQGNRLPGLAPVAWSPVSDPDAVETVIRFAPGRRVKGRLVDPRGAGIAGIAVRANPVAALVPNAHDPNGGVRPEAHGEAVSDRDGRFEFDSLGAWSYRCLAALPPPLLPAGPWTLTADATEATLPTIDGMFAVVTVEDTDGRPVTAAQVNAWPIAGGGAYETPARLPAAGADGRVHVGPVAPGAHYTLDVAAPFQRQDVARTTIAPWTPADTTVRLERAYTVRGVVHDLDGKAVPALVQMRDENGAFKPRAGTSRDGSFVVLGLRAGPVTLRAAPMPMPNSPGSPGPDVTVDAGAADVVLTLGR